MAVQPSEIASNTPNNASGGAVLGSVHQIESLARARGDVLLHESHLSNDDLVQTANELAQLAGYLAQISTARSEFLSKVAHELRTPLTVAKGWISMLRYGELLPDQERVIEVVDQQVDELTRLVGDLLDLSRREADTLVLQLEMVNLIDLVEQVVEHRRELTSLKGIQLIVRAPQNEEIYACIDRGRVAQVLNNLIDNACRYVEHYRNGRIELSINGTETAAHISIRDNGIGVPQEHLPRIFEPFYQVKGQKRGKCGLGLAITHELIAAHGGSVTVESKLGHGTCFHIWLRKMEPSDTDTQAREANL